MDDLTTGRIANLVDARGYGKEFTFFNMDVRAEGLLPLFERHRPEVVFHLAAQSGVRPSLADPTLDASINIMGTLNVLECAAKVEARKVIYAASGGTIYGEPKRLPAKETAAQGSNPLSPYGISKKVALDYLGFFQRYRGLDFTALALGNVYGPRQDPHGEAGVSRSSRSGCWRTSPSRSSETATRRGTYVFIDDVAHAFVQAMDRGSGKLVNIGTGLESSVNHVYRLLADIIGLRAGARARPAPAGGAPTDRARHRCGPVGDRVEALDASRGRPRRDRGLPQGHLTPGRGLPRLENALTLWHSHGYPVSTRE